MYKIQLTVVNPMQKDGSGDSEQVLFQFDPNTLDAAKWASAFPTVQGMIAALKTRSAPNEPAVW